MTYQEGDPNHIGVHGDLVNAVQDLADDMGVDVDLPPIRQLGDSGHVGDHNLIQAALDKIAAEGSAGASWAQVISAPDAVTGSYYDDKGGQWAFYEWNAAGTFDVELSGGILWVLCVGGGDGGEGDANSHEQSGQPGLVREGYWEFGPGTHTVTVGERGSNNSLPRGRPSFIDDVLTGFSTQGESAWGSAPTGRGVGGAGYVSTITGDPMKYANAYNEEERPGRSGFKSNQQRDGAVIIATRIDVPALPPAPPRLEVAPVIAKPAVISGPDVQEWLVRDKQGNRKVVYFLPGNTGTARSLALTDEGAEALAARRELLDAIATTDVPDDYDGDPVTLLPKKLRGELRGFVEVQATAQPAAVFSVTLGAGVFPGVMVGAGGSGGGKEAPATVAAGGGGGAGGVIGQGAHVPVILPVQGTATYTVTVPSTTPLPMTAYSQCGGSCSLAVQGQTPFATAVGGGGGTAAVGTGQPGTGSNGASGGGAGAWSPSLDVAWHQGYPGIPGQGSQGGEGKPGGATNGGAGGGYGSRPTGPNPQTGGDGFDLATALNLDANDGLTGSFLGQCSVDGWIAGGGSASGGVAHHGGGGSNSAGKDHSGGGGGGSNSENPGAGGAGAVFIITDSGT